MERNRGGRPRHPDLLTPAEQRVLEELRVGGTNAEIAVRLGVSPDAVKYHISNMLGKLELGDRRQLAAWRPDTPRSRVRALLPLPLAFGSLARPVAWVGAGTVALAAIAAVIAVLVVVNGDGDQPLVVSPPPTETPQPTPSPSPTAEPTPTVTPSPPATHSVTPSSTPSATRAPIEYVPLTLGEPRPLPPGATLYFRESGGSCHGPVWWRRAVATAASELAWDNPLGKLPAFSAADWSPENWPPQLAGVSSSGRTLVARVCERGVCMSLDRMDADAVEALWGSTDAGETWERWGDDPEGGIWDVSDTDVAFRDADGRVKGLRSGEEWAPPEELPRPWVSSEVNDRLLSEEREPGELDLYVVRDQGGILGAYSWGGEGSYESHRPLWIVDHLEGHLFVGFLGSEACGDGTKTVLVDFGSGTVHTVPGLDPGVDLTGYPTLYAARLTQPSASPSATPDGPPEPDIASPAVRPSLPEAPVFEGPPGVYTTITVGVQHACALSEDGEAVCWDIEGGVVWGTPPGTYTFIETGGDDTCAITDEGAIVCWARGGGEIPESVNRLDPSSGAPSNRYKELSWANPYTCALIEAGSPVCWHPGDPKDVWPTRPPDPPLGTYSSIDVEYFYDGYGGQFLTACATSDAGDLVCWQATNTSPTEQRTSRYAGTFVEVEVAGSGFCALTEDGRVASAHPSWTCGFDNDSHGPYAALSVGDAYKCAVTEDGTVVCVGDDAGAWFSGSPSAMTPPDSLSGRVTEVSVGGGWGVAQSLVCALTDAGAAVCWRDVERRADRPEPPAGGYVAMSDGLGHTCALTNEGQASCWGWNNFGQLDVPPGRYSAISAGHRSSCALSDPGVATCWGSAAQSPWSAPGESPWSAPAEHRYTVIEAGFGEACALTETGAPVCWNSAGPSTGPLGDPPPGSFVSISLGWPGHACALTEGGEGVCWGRDSDGQLAVPPGRYRAISAGDSLYSCGIDLAGDLVCWGDVPSGIAGFPPGPYVTLTTGWAHVCGLTAEGRAVCRGFLDLYKGTTYGEDQPLAGRYVSVASSMFRTCGLTAAGEVVCRGDVAYAEWPYFHLPGVYEEH